MKFLVLLTLLLFFGITLPVRGQSSPQFEAYRVKIYKGRIHNPEWIRHVSGDEWRDQVDKFVGPPEINFAGKYFIAIHGGGSYCRYYTLTDLSSGRDLDILIKFMSDQPRAGEPSDTELVTRANSKLLVAQFYVRSSSGGEKCRQRAFVLEGKTLRPITKTQRSCTKY